MSRRRRHLTRCRRGVGPVGIQVRDAGSDALDEFFLFGSASVFPYGCSAHDAVRISRDGGTAAYPMGDGLERSDIAESRRVIGDEPLTWSHDCPDDEKIVVSSSIAAG